MEMTQRGRLSEEERQNLVDLQEIARKAHETLADYRREVIEIVGVSSFREVSAVTGISTTTLQKWKREVGK